MNGTLPEWIQRCWGVEAGPGEGAAWHLRNDWPWPPWATLLLVAGMIVFVALVYGRENRRTTRPLRVGLASIRLAAIGIVLAMIAQFVLCVERTGLPDLAVVLDDSASMTIVDRDEGRQGAGLARRLAAAGLDAATPSRENLAKTLLLEGRARWLRRFADDYRLRFYCLTGERESRAADVTQLADEIRQAKADGRATRLGAGVRRVLDDLRGTSPVGIVLLTDGINTEGPGLDDAASLARRRDVPLMIVGLGDDRPVADLKLTDLLVDDRVFVDDMVSFEATLVAAGYGGRELRVVLRRDGRPEVLAETHVKADADGRPQGVRLSYQPHEAGRFRYVLEVEPPAGERQTDNNRQTGEIDVRKGQIRVLLVQAYPSFEYRYLSKLLGRDTTIRLDTLLQDADLEHAGQDAAALAVFPVRRKELFEYDVVILGDVDFATLGRSAIDDLAATVDRPTGGALVFIAGPRYNPAALRDTPLERLLPITLGSVHVPPPDAPATDGFAVEPTELGLASPAMQVGDDPAATKEIWRKLPPLYWMIDAPDLKAGARVLVVNRARTGHDGRPLAVIAIQYVGAAKVLMHMTDETWRWRRGAGDRYFARYWTQMIRWLARSKLGSAPEKAALGTDRREYQLGETVRFRLRLADPRAADDQLALVVEQEGQPTRRIPLARHAIGEVFEATMVATVAGRCHAWATSPAMSGAPPAVDFTIAPPAGEFQRTEMAAATLRRAAEQTRGRFYTIANAGRLPGDLPSGRQVPIETLPPAPLWNRWPVVLLLFVLLIAEWIVRRMKGMA
jgi:hypothetical protein